MVVNAVVIGGLLAFAAAPSANVAEASNNAVASVDTEQGDALVVTPVAEEEIGFIDLYFPFMPDPILDQAPLEPEVQENFWLLYIVYVAGSFVASPVWAHMIFLGDVDVGEDHLMEALIGWLIHAPFVWTAWFFVIGWILGGINIVYLVPLQGVQTLDRNIKKVRGKPPAKWAAQNGVAPEADLNAVNMAF